MQAGVLYIIMQVYMIVLSLQQAGPIITKFTESCGPHQHILSYLEHSLQSNGPHQHILSYVEHCVKCFAVSAVAAV